MKNRTCRNIRWIWRMIYQHEPREEQQRCVTRLSLLLKRVCLHGCNHEKINNKYKLINIVISNENDSHNANAVGRKQCTCKHGCHINRLNKSSIDQYDEHINGVTDDTIIFACVSLVVIQSAVRPMENNICVNNDQMVRHWWRRTGGVWARWNGYQYGYHT